MVISMEIRNLITFVTVAETASFTKAAALLGYSQSTVSFQIKQLETELDCLLFERINHTINLTQQGRDLLKYANKIRKLTDEFKDNTSKNSSPQGHIHVVVPDSLCEYMVNSNYIKFRKKYPDISLKFTNADTADMFDMLDRNQADIVMTLDDHVYHSDYIIEKEEPVKMHFVANPHSRFASCDNLSISDIISEPFVLTERYMGYRKIFDRELAKQSLDIKPALEIGRTDIITKIIEKEDMISFLPDFVTEKKVRDGKLIYLDIKDLNADIWKQLIYHKNKWISGCLSTFIEYVKKVEFSS